MAHTYEELKKKTIAELRDLAKDIQHEAVQGYTQLNKEHLLPALCKALGIDSHAHHAAAIAEKAAVKARMREINAEKATGPRERGRDLARQLRRQYQAEPLIAHGGQTRRESLSSARLIRGSGRLRRTPYLTIATMATMNSD